MAVSIPTGPLPDILASLGDIARSRSAKWLALGVTAAMTYDKLGITWGQTKWVMGFTAAGAVLQKLDDIARLVMGQNPRAYLVRGKLNAEVMPKSNSTTPTPPPAPVNVTVNP